MDLFFVSSSSDGICYCNHQNQVCQLMCAHSVRLGFVDASTDSHCPYCITLQSVELSMLHCLPSIVHSIQFMFMFICICIVLCEPLLQLHAECSMFLSVFLFQFSSNLLFGLLHSINLPYCFTFLLIFGSAIVSIAEFVLVFDVFHVIFVLFVLYLFVCLFVFLEMF